MTQVSVIVPTYRRPHFLVHALRSASTQALDDIEVLVCDNAADPQTKAVVESLADPRIRYCPRDHNLGMVRNAMLGFQQSRGQFVMKLDDDDVLQPDALRRLASPLLQDTEVGLSFGHVLLIAEDGAPLPQETAELDRSSGRKDLRQGVITQGSRLVASGGVQLAGAMIRRSVTDWEAVPEEVATAYDLYLALKAVERGHHAYFLDEPVVQYRLHEGSDTHQHLGPQLLGACAVLEQALASGSHQDTAPLRERLAGVNVEAARVFIRQGETEKARQHAHRAIELRRSMPAWRVWVMSHLPGKVVSAAARAHARSASKHRPHVRK